MQPKWNLSALFLQQRNRKMKSYAYIGHNITVIFFGYLGNQWSEGLTKCIETL